MVLNSKKEFDKSIDLTAKAFYVSGFEIGDSKFNFFQWLYFFNLLWLYVDVFGELSWLVEGMRMGKRLDELSMVAPCFTVCLLGTAKILPFFLNKQTFQEAIRMLRAIHPNGELNDVETEILQESHKYLMSVIVFFSVAAASVVVIFSCEPLMLMGYEYYNTGIIVLKLPFLIKYFFDAYANATVWSLVYFHQVWSTVIVCVNLFAADTLFYIFCTYLRMHFRILGNEFKNVVTHSLDETRKNMRKCVSRHQELITLVNLLEILYSKSTLFNIISSSILLCLSGFNITVVQKASTVLTFSPFLVMSLTQVFLICFFGDLLMASVSVNNSNALRSWICTTQACFVQSMMRQSIQISDAVYSCRWYDAEPTIRRSVLIVIIKSQKPCKVTAANFADLNLTAFTTILSRSWSCFALLKTIYN